MCGPTCGNVDIEHNFGASHILDAVGHVERKGFGSHFSDECMETRIKRCDACRDLEQKCALILTPKGTVLRTTDTRSAINKIKRSGRSIKLS